MVGRSIVKKIRAFVDQDGLPPVKHRAALLGGGLLLARPLCL
jgi:hypothetical protein